MMLYSESHTEAAWFGAIRELQDLPVVARFTVDGEPASKARARFSKGHAFTPAETTAAEQMMGWAFRQAARSHAPNKETQYGVVALFFSATRQRRDVDNMLKLVLDGLNKIAWHDDSQVFEITGRKMFCPKGDERTAVLIYTLPSQSLNVLPCVVCDKPTQTYPSQNQRPPTCSPECASFVSQGRRQPAKKPSP